MHAFGLGHVQVDDEGDELGDEGELGFPPGSFRPGRVVWAKVDGHEWWPAKVRPCCIVCMPPLIAACSAIGPMCRSLLLYVVMPTVCRVAMRCCMDASGTSAV